MAFSPLYWIYQYAPKLGLDPRAVAAVALSEGGLKWGAVGDSGSSYGPFQLHVGGALPRGQTAAWANSPEGMLYAMRSMSNAGAKGLTGRAAIEAIVRNFERPAAPGPEIQRALGQYGGINRPAQAQAYSQPGEPGYNAAAANLILGFARKQIGQPYLWGGESRAEGGFDCSGIIYAAYKRAGYQGVGRTTYELIHQGVPVHDYRNLMPGDLVFPTTGHVGIYLGSGKVLSAPRTGETIHVTPLSEFGVGAGMRRLVQGGGGIVAPKSIKGMAPSGLPQPDPQALNATLALQQQQLASAMAGIRQNLLLKTLPQTAPDVPQPAAAPTGSLSNPLQAAAIDQRSSTLTGLRQEAMRRAGLAA